MIRPSYDDWKTTEPEERSWREDEPARPNRDPFHLAEERRCIAREELRALDRTARDADASSGNHRDFLLDRISEHLRNAERTFADFSRDREVLMHQLGASRFHLGMAARLTRDLRDHFEIEDRENDEVRALARAHESRR